MISILMPVKNAGLFLEACLDSIIQQTAKGWELIAVNDHSDDNSHEILQDYATRDNRIKTYTNTGTGIIDALRLAYQKSSGAYITRMDADDIMTPSKLSQLSQPLIKNGRGSLAVGLVKYFSEDTLGGGYKAYEEWLNSITKTKNNFTSIYKECSIPSPAWMLHREDLDLCNAFTPDVYPEDYDLAFRMRAANFNLYPTIEVVHLWRDHSDRSSRTDDNYKDNTFLKLKVDHFLRSDMDSNKQLVLWGAGKKGKNIAKQLSFHKIPFKWITNNSKKIGKEIYQKILESDNAIESEDNTQLIIAIAHPEEQHKIKRRLGIKDNEGAEDSFFFC